MTQLGETVPAVIVFWQREGDRDSRGERQRAERKAWGLGSTGEGEERSGEW